MFPSVTFLKNTYAQHSTMCNMLSAWFVWLLSGTIFYAEYANFGWSKGLYMSVNVGYSIGFGYPVETSDKQMWYSIVHCILGASAVAACLGVFAQAMLEENKKWYEAAVKRAKTDSMLTSLKFSLRLLATAQDYYNRLFPLVVWLGWILMGCFWACEIFDWPVVQGLYFAVSTCSTGGLFAIPIDSSDETYFMVALYAAVGVPLAGFAMGNLASQMLFTTERVDEVQALIDQPVTETELSMMKAFGLEDGDGEIDKAEFVILCMARMGAADPSIVKLMIQKYQSLDTSGDGSISYAELMGQPEVENDKNQNSNSTTTSNIMLTQVGLNKA